MLPKKNVIKKIYKYLSGSPLAISVFASLAVLVLYVAFWGVLFGGFYIESEKGDLNIIILQQFSSFIMSVVTLWYVVFTYFMFRDARRNVVSQNEPLLSFYFDKMKKTTPNDLHLDFVDFNKELLTIISTFSGKDDYDRLSGVEGDHCILCITNVRNTSAARVKFLVQIELFVETGDDEKKERTDIYSRAVECELPRQTIVDNSVYEVVILGLHQIPFTYSVSVKLVSSGYYAVDNYEDLISAKVYNGDWLGKGTLVVSG